MKAHVSFRGESHVYDLPDDSLVYTLKETIQECLQLNASHQKLLHRGIQLDDESPIPTIGKIMVLASSVASISAIHESVAATRHSSSRVSESKGNSATINSTRTPSSRYTFNRISVLNHLPSPDTSRAFLDRLSNDRAIQKLMQRHSLTVGLLTEMDPRLYTSHESKVLGLNKNAGQEILLRLRTDELDGWRDYKTVRSTLVHELVHNIHGKHDRSFWDLFNLMVKQVAEHESGRALSDEEVYVPPEALQTNHGPEWSGGTSILGSASDAGHLNPREARAKAAEERSRSKQSEM